MIENTVTQMKILIAIRIFCTAMIPTTKMRFKINGSTFQESISVNLSKPLTHFLTLLISDPEKLLAKNWKEC